MKQIEVINLETIIDVTAETSNVEILVQDYDSELAERFALEAQESAIDAEESADIATAQASIATAQAGIATTQAGNALTSANNAAASAQEAQDIVDSIITADLTEATSSVLTITGGTDAVLGTGTTIQVKQAGSSQSGFLSSTDWTTFNSKQNTITNPVTGTGASGQVAFWNDTNTQTGDNGLFWDNTNKRLGVNTNAPLRDFQVTGTAFLNGGSTTAEHTVYGRIKFSTNPTSARLAVISGDSTSLNLSTNNFANSVSLTYSTGNFLINTTTDAGFRLDVNGTARVQGALSISVPSVASTRENILTARVSDNATDVFGISNGTTTNARFSPTFFNFSNGNYAASTFRGLTSAAGDNGTTPLIIFQAGRTDSTSDPNNGTITEISTRPILRIDNQNTTYAQIFATGNLLLQNGGTFTDVASAILNVNSTTQGFLPPRMTTTQKNAIASPATGLVVYDNTLNKLSVFTGLVWETVTSL